MVLGKAAQASGPVNTPVAATLRHAGFPKSQVTAIRLSHPAPTRKAATAIGLEKRVRVGSGRDVASETELLSGPARLQWIAAPAGGRTARIEVTSPLAGALRLGLRVRGLPEGAELRFTGSSESGRVLGPFAGVAAVEATRRHGLYWTPVTAGEHQGVEIWVPASADGAILTVEAVSHLEAAPADLLKSTAKAAQSCNQDVACISASDPAVANAARAVAKLMFTENAVTYLCTGTLVNDGDPASQVPYLYTAAHCIDSQAAAATLNTFWFYQASACGAKTASAPRQLSGGATLLHANTSSDAALLRLAEPAPAGAWFAGWDAAPLAGGEELVALHHPLGDLKKASIGQAIGEAEQYGSSYTNVAWRVGSTEGGSSGSGIFTRAGNEYLLRGGLRGGSASCASSGNVSDGANRDQYSRLDLEAPRLATWLKATTAPAFDFTDMWWNPSESGWGMSFIQGAANQVFAVLYTYDAGGDPLWLVLPAATWTSATVLEGNLYRTRGTPMQVRYDAANFSFAPAGSARIQFADSDSGTMTVVIDGQTTVKAIRRQPL